MMFRSVSHKPNLYPLITWSIYKACASFGSAWKIYAVCLQTPVVDKSHLFFHRAAERSSEPDKILALFVAVCRLALSITWIICLAQRATTTGPVTMVQKVQVQGTLCFKIIAFLESKMLGVSHMVL